MAQVTDINISETAVLAAPEYLAREVARTNQQAAFVAKAREQIHNIIFGDDKRLLVVIGPCSIHDVEAGREYAHKLKALADELSDRLLLVMRVYFEKPRTTVGWKGLIMDPALDGSADIHAGLKIARQFLRHVIDCGLPTATELLDPITPQYIADLVCWSAIGARTSESQTHRQMASGLSMPLGFKNTTSGDVQAAINAIKAATQPQTFLGVSQQGLASVITTKGNPNCHIILRGGSDGPNYDSSHTAAAEELLKANGLLPAIMVDASHGNSNKDHNRQPEVLEDVVRQIINGRTSLIGAMIESNLKGGNQQLISGHQGLEYGKSITDACIDWATTEAVLRKAHADLAPRVGN